VSVHRLPSHGTCTLMSPEPSHMPAYIAQSEHTLTITHV
jgi:hypothetical protein